MKYTVDTINKTLTIDGEIMLTELLILLDENPYLKDYKLIPTIVTPSTFEPFRTSPFEIPCTKPDFTVTDKNSGINTTVTYDSNTQTKN
jgi:hypothetical protein